MSSAPSGRYQSRFFNFVARRSRQFTDKLDQTIRQMKVATVWGAQILLYPFYALFQASRLAGRQLHTSVTHDLPRLLGIKHTADEPGVIPDADRPVQQVLQTIQAWELPVVSTPLSLQPADLDGDLAVWSAASDLVLSAPTAFTLDDTNGTPAATDKTAIAIQGVASLLETHSLVLVTTQNQILDVLSPAQQQQLRHRIIWEVSDYQRSLRLATRRPWHSLFGFKPKNSRLLPPVRLLYRLMVWVQNSPVAIAANLFQESTWVVQSRLELPPSLFAAQPRPELPNFDFSMRPRQFAAGIVPLPTISYSTLAPLDRAIAELETHPWLPVLATLPSAIAQRIQGLVQHWQQLATADTTELATNGEHPTPHTLNGQLQALIRAAVNYFFLGKRPSISGEATELWAEQALPSPSPFYKVGGISDRTLPGDEILDPDLWLTFDDLFGNPIVVDEGEDFDGGSAADPDKLAIAASAIHPPLPGQVNHPSISFPGGAIAGLVAKLRSWVRGMIGIGSSTDLTHQPPWDRAIASPGATGKLTGVATPAQPLTTAATLDGHLSPTTPATGQINTTWIETEATTVGYVKHPLERVLGWLDRAMLWLEECFVLLGQWLQRLWHR